MQIKSAQTLANAGQSVSISDTVAFASGIDFKSIYTENSVFIWNKSHLDVFEFSSGVIDHRYSFLYSGYHPEAIAEFLATKVTAGIKNAKTSDFLSNLEKIWKRSVSTYDYYDHITFPINVIDRNLSQEIFTLLQKKLGVDQIVLLDVDSATEYRIYSYSIPNGLLKMSAASESSRFDFTWKDITEVSKDDKFISQVTKSLRLDSSLTTAWIISGDISQYIGSNFTIAVYELFSKLRSTFPIYSEIYLDVNQLIQHSNLWSYEVLSTHIKQGLKPIPLKIVNLDHVKYKVFLEGSTVNRSLQLRPDPNRLNFFHLNEDVNLAFMPFKKISPGLLWLDFPKAKYTKLEVETKIAEFLQTPFTKTYANVFSSEFPLTRQTTWSVKLSKSIAAEFSKGEQVALDRKKTNLKINQLKYIYTPHLRVEDLIVVNGQTVNENEPLNKSRKVNFIYEVPVYKTTAKGIVSTSQINSGFIGIKSSNNYKKNLHWIEQASAQVLRKNVNNSVDLLVNASSLPLYIQRGTEASATLLAAETIAELSEYAELPGIIAIVREKMTAKEIMNAYREGIKHIVVPSISDAEIQKIPQSYWNIFGFGSLGKDLDYIPDEIWRKILHKQDQEAFLSQKQELKFIQSDFGKYTFGLNRGYENPLVLAKGSKVMLAIGDNMYKEYIVKYIDKQLSEALLQIEGTGEYIYASLASILLIR